MKINNPNDTIAGLTKAELYEIIFAAVSQALAQVNQQQGTAQADRIAADLAAKHKNLLKG